jgi:hypothetical protein
VLDNLRVNIDFFFAKAALEVSHRDVTSIDSSSESSTLVARFVTLLFRSSCSDYMRN